MKRFALFVLGLAAAALLSAPLFAQQAKPPELTVKATTDFLKLPNDVYFGEAVGVSLDSKGNIYVANRGKHPLMEFHPDGTFMRFIGEGLDIYGAPHSVFLDPQDNIWYVDAETNLIVKLDQQTRLQMVFGKKPEAWTWETHVVEHGAPGPSNFYQPLRVGWLRQLARRPLRRRRSFHQGLGQARLGARAIQHAAHARRGSEGHRVRGRPGEPPRPGV
jgi:hypothetical protein